MTTITKLAGFLGLLILAACGSSDDDFLCDDVECAGDAVCITITDADAKETQECVDAPASCDSVFDDQGSCESPPPIEDSPCTQDLGALCDAGSEFSVRGCYAASKGDIGSDYIQMSCDAS